jgi:hypothetical protein
MFPKGGYNLDNPHLSVGGSGDDIEILAGMLEEAEPSWRRVYQFLIEIGVPAVNKHIADYLHEKPGRPACNPEFPEFVQGADNLFAKKKRYGLPVSGRSIVVWYLPQCLSGGGSCRGI